jgi:hypothetical protein
MPFPLYLKKLVQRNAYSFVFPKVLIEKLGKTCVFSAKTKALNRMEAPFSMVDMSKLIMSRSPIARWVSGNTESSAALRIHSDGHVRHIGITLYCTAI